MSSLARKTTWGHKKPCTLGTLPSCFFRPEYVWWDVIQGVRSRNMGHVCNGGSFLVLTNIRQLVEFFHCHSTPG